MLLQCSKSFMAAQGTSTTKISKCINSLLGATSCLLPPTVPCVCFSHPLMHTPRVYCGYGGRNSSSSTPGRRTITVCIVLVTLYRREVMTVESLRAVGMRTVCLSENIAIVTFPSCHVSHQLMHYVFLYCKMYNFAHIYKNVSL